MIPTTYGADRPGLRPFWNERAVRVGGVARWSCAALLSWSCGGDASIDASMDLSATSVSPNAGAERSGKTASGTDGPQAQRIAIMSLDGSALRGARLYDNFYAEDPALGFRPDDPLTPQSDGSGGPFGDGTLLDGLGAALDSSADHGYRLASVLGWDLRGADGIYGRAYQDKAYVAHLNLMEDSLSREQVAELIVDGARGVPAYGQVLSTEDLTDVVAFIMAARGGDWLQPGDVWHLDAGSPSGYILKPGGRVERGHELVRSSCSTCHGSDGTQLLFDGGEFSLGTLARRSAFEVFFKLLAGSAGTPMTSQIHLEEPWAAQAQMALDVLAALCDRAAYPAGRASLPDSPTDDGCGYYPH